MKKNPQDGGTLANFLADPFIVTHRLGNDASESETETPEHENATPAPDAAPTAALDVGNHNTTERNAS